MSEQLCGMTSPPGARGNQTRDAFVVSSAGFSGSGVEALVLHAHSYIQPLTLILPAREARDVQTAPESGRRLGCRQRGSRSTAGGPLGPGADL